MHLDWKGMGRRRGGWHEKMRGGRWRRLADPTQKKPKNLTQLENPTRIKPQNLTRLADPTRIEPQNLTRAAESIRMESKKMTQLAEPTRKKAQNLTRAGKPYTAGSGELDTGYTSSADRGKKRAAGDRSDPHLRAIN